MPRTRWHTQIWPTPRVARGKARNDKANREQLALKSGGEEGDRTLDLRIANATLSQLSYFPISVDFTPSPSGRTTPSAAPQV